MPKNNNLLFRYTSLPILFDILKNKQITLLDPDLWEDRNDTNYIKQYSKQKKLESVLALCFTTKNETFHHWKVFAGNSSGIFITFNKDKLLTSFNNPAIQYGPVLYKKIDDLEKKYPLLDKLPFIKRWPCRDEAEFRVIYHNTNKQTKNISFPIKLKCIESIILSPWLPKPVAKTVIKIIKQMPGCSSIKLYRTGLIENIRWVNIATKSRR